MYARLRPATVLGLLACSTVVDVTIDVYHNNGCYTDRHRCPTIMTYEMHSSFGIGVLYAALMPMPVHCP